MVLTSCPFHDLGFSRSFHLLLVFCGGKCVLIYEVDLIQIMYFFKTIPFKNEKQKPFNHDDHEHPQNKHYSIQPMKHNEK